MIAPQKAVIAGLILLATALTAWLTLGGGPQPQRQEPAQAPRPVAEPFDLAPPRPEPPPVAVTPGHIVASPSPLELQSGASGSVLLTNDGGTAAAVTALIVGGSGVSAGGCVGTLDAKSSCRIEVLAGNGPASAELAVIGPGGVLVRVPVRIAAPAVVVSPPPAEPVAPTIDPFVMLLAQARAAQSQAGRASRLVDSRVPQSDAGLPSPVVSGAPARDYGEAFPKVVSSPPVDLSRTILQDTPIHMTLTRAINSQLPGPVSAMVEAPVFGKDGQTIVLPAGSEVIGRYEGGKQGKTRLAVVWTRIVRARDHAQFDLRGSPAIAADEVGRVGLHDEIDERLLDRYGGMALSTIFDVAASVAESRLSRQGSSSNGTVVVAGERANSGTQSIAKALLDRNIDLEPIHTVRQGFRFLILPATDLWLVPVKPPVLANAEDWPVPPGAASGTGTGVGLPAPLPIPVTGGRSDGGVALPAPR